MPRAIWSGAISFGLVNVPVKLFSAVSPKDVRFNQLEEGTGARIRQKRVSAETGEEVPYEKIVKGFEVSPDRYVITSPEELEALDPKATRAIDIEDFVDLDQIDPVHYERPYYLVPEKGAAKAYALLLQAMKESNKVAIARLVLRTKQYLAAIRPMGGIGGRQLTPSNLEKVLCPEAGFTKGQVIDYYRRIAPALLPHLRGRPLTLKRYPNGVDSQYFYEKQCPSHRPPWVEVAPVWSGHNRRTINFCLVEDLPTLIWVANLASLELHTALHRAAGSTGAPDETWTPDMLVFDLDPGEPAAFAECAGVGLWLWDELDGLGPAAFP